MNIEERHGTISWVEDAEPPYPGRVHLILENTERDGDDACTAACGIGKVGYPWVYDEVDGPVNCKRCLRVKPCTLERIKKEMKENIRE